LFILINYLFIFIDFFHLESIKTNFFLQDFVHYCQLFIRFYRFRDSKSIPHYLNQFKSLFLQIVFIIVNYLFVFIDLEILEAIPHYLNQFKSIKINFLAIICSLLSINY